jgi:hypothetical protein
MASDKNDILESKFRAQALIIVEVFHPTVRDIQGDRAFKFFSNNSEIQHPKPAVSR